MIRLLRRSQFNAILLSISRSRWTRIHRGRLISLLGVVAILWWILMRWWISLVSSVIWNPACAVERLATGSSAAAGGDAGDAQADEEEEEDY